MTFMPVSIPAANKPPGQDERGFMEYITLKAGKYEAHILPELGGNVIYFYDHQQQREILKGTHDREALKNRPTTYGMPFLFPPNRIDGGRFLYDGRQYRLPVNEPARNNHIHGFFKTADYRVAAQQHTPERAEVILEYVFDENDANFIYFPHKMRICKAYELTEQGLKTTLTITNQSNQTMPVMLAYHTAFPLMPDRQQSAEMNVRLSIKARVQLDDRLLGTESYVAGDQIAAMAAESGFSPLAEVLDNVYQMKSFGFRGAIITYPAYKAQTVYEVDDIFHYFVVWNSGANGEILCTEPQTCRNNGINLPSWQKDGIDLPAGEDIRVVTKLSSEDMA